MRSKSITTPIVGNMVCTEEERSALSCPTRLTVQEGIGWPDSVSLAARPPLRRVEITDHSALDALEPVVPKGRVSRGYACVVRGFVAGEGIGAREDIPNALRAWPATAPLVESIQKQEHCDVCLLTGNRVAASGGVGGG